MNLNKLDLQLIQRYSDSTITITQENDAYQLSYSTMSKLSSNTKTFRRVLSQDEAVWLEKELNVVLRKINMTTWQSLPGGDKMTVYTVYIVKKQKTCVNIKRGLPLNKYSDFMHLLEKLAKYGSK